MGFSRQEHWIGLPCPPPGDLPNPEIKPTSLLSPSLAGGFFIAGQLVKNPPALQETPMQFLGLEDLLEEG